MAFTPFPPRQPTASARLPLTLMTLDDWALATITGADSEKYMQGQVTADVSQMTEDQHLLAAHCDAKGKMWSNLRLFRDGDGFAWIERRSVREPQLTELKKYAVFSKVTIAPDDERVLLGVAGFQARAALANLFSELPSREKQVVKEGATTLLWFEHPAERFLIVTDEATANMLTDKLRGEAELNNSQQWLALNIEAGFPVIDAANSGQSPLRQSTNRSCPWRNDSSRCRCKRTSYKKDRNRTDKADHYPHRDSCCGISQTICLLSMGEDIACAIHAHPTLSEVIHEAAMALNNKALHG